MSACRLDGLGIGQPLDALQSIRQQLIGPILNDLGCLRVGRASGRGIIFKATIGWWIVRGGDHDTVSQPRGASGIVGQNGVGDHRGWRITKAGLDHQVSSVGGKNFNRGGVRRFRERVGVHPHKEWTSNATSPPQFADRLTDRKDVIFVKLIFARGPPMPRGAKGDPLPRIAGIGFVRIIGRDEARDIG